MAINKIHPESFRIHSPAWDHQKLFTAGRALEAELGLRPLRSRAREGRELPQRAADYEAQQGVDSFARWARETLAPALRAIEIVSRDDMHRTCGRFGVLLRSHGNGLVFEDVERGIRVKASSVSRELSKPRLCRLHAVARAGPSRTRARLERVPGHRRARASRPEGEISPAAKNPRHPTRVWARSTMPLQAARAPPSDRGQGAQAKTRRSTKGGSEDSAPRLMARFRRQWRREPRRPCDSTSAARAKSMGSRKGLVRLRVTTSGQLAYEPTSASVEVDISRLVPRNLQSALHMSPMG